MRSPIVFSCHLPKVVDWLWRNPTHTKVITKLVLLGRTSVTRKRAAMSTAMYPQDSFQYILDDAVSNSNMLENFG